MTTSARKIGPVLATFVVANNMIGSGFFLLPASLAKSGTVTALSWLLGTVLAVMLGATFARLARRHPHLTCPDDYVQPALGRSAGFLVSTLYWLSSWIGNNAIAVAAIGYLIVLLPIQSTPGVHLLGQILLIWSMFALNLLGPRRVAQFQSFCVVFGLLPVAAILMAGWWHFDLQLWREGWNITAHSDVHVTISSLSEVFWAFVGLETGAMVAGVVRDPDRNVPIATIGGIVVAGVIYLISSVLMMGIVSVQALSESSAPFALVAGEMFGPWAIPLIAAAAALKASGTLGGWMMVTGESGVRAAQRGFLPPIFGHARSNGAASTGLLLVVSSMTLIALSALSGSVSNQFENIINMAVSLVVLAYATAGLSLMLGTPEHRPNLPDRLLGLCALAACALLIWSTPWHTLLGASVIAVLALIAYRLFRPHA